jgi:hypothetical protein
VFPKCKWPCEVMHASWLLPHEILDHGSKCTWNLDPGLRRFCVCVVRCRALRWSNPPSNVSYQIILCILSMVLFYLKTTFRRMDSASFFRQKPIQFGPVDWDSPYHGPDITLNKTRRWIMSETLITVLICHDHVIYILSYQMNINKDPKAKKRDSWTSVACCVAKREECK